jgi:hypothetical protein
MTEMIFDQPSSQEMPFSRHGPEKRLWGRAAAALQAMPPAQGIFNSVNRGSVYESN